MFRFICNASRRFDVAATSRLLWRASGASKRPQVATTSQQRIETLQELTKAGKLQAAIDLLDATKPETTTPLYNSVIGVLAKQGNVKAAFKTYNRMKKHGLGSTDRTYGHLFTACASNRSKRSLQELCKLVEKLVAADLELSVVSWNAAIRALARHQMTFEALDLLQKMEDNFRIEPDVRSFTHALEACRHDRSDGIRLADLVWRDMEQRAIRPDLLIYNQYVSVYGERGRAVVPFGSVGALLRHMRKSRVEPDIRTFHALESLAGSDDEMLSEIRNEMDRRGLKADIVFMNGRVAERAGKGDLQGAKTILREMGLKPDVRTYQALSVACKEEEDARKILESMEESGVKPNVYVYGTLMKNAAKFHQFNHLIWLMKKMERSDVKPNDVIMSILDSAAARSKRERAKSPHVTPKDGFRGFLRIWKTRNALYATPTETEE